MQLLKHSVSILLLLSFLNFYIILHKKLDFESNFEFDIRDNTPILRIIKQLFDHHNTPAMDN